MRTVRDTVKLLSALSLALATTAGVAGCGGGTDQDAGRDGPIGGARQSLRLIAAGLQDGDGPRVCSLLYRGAQDALMRSAGGSNCIEAVARAAGTLDDGIVGRFADLADADVQVADGVAHVTGPGPDALADALNLKGLWLSDFEDDWMVQANAAAPGDSP